MNACAPAWFDRPLTNFRRDRFGDRLDRWRTTALPTSSWPTR